MNYKDLFSKDNISYLLQLITVLVAYIAGKYAAKQEQQITSRKIFENCYQKIFKLIERDFYSEKLSISDLHTYANQILEIFEESKGYYYHSLEEYCRQLAQTTDPDNAKETWEAFCWSFDRQLIKVEKSLGLPIRSFSYRMNRKQYSDWKQIFMIFFLSFPTFFFLLVIFLLLLILQANIPFH